jgi:antirestriction protein ArdC
MSGKHEEQMKEITERLEKGVQELFTSEKYTEYLKAMSQFHNYSFNNTLLIAMQKPEATLVAGYGTWNKKFNRQVKRGEKGIKIFAPIPIKQKDEIEKFDPETSEPILRPDGQPETEEVVHIIPRFRVTTVFDISQTYGDPLPELDAPELMGGVENFPVFMEAIENVSPVPIRYAEIEGESKGYYSNIEKEIVIQDRMSEKQTMKTAVHEVTHAMCHDRDIMEELGEKKNRMTKEVEAESVAYTVCSYFGLDTSDYSFPYIAGWSSDMEMKELRSSMEFIRKTAGSFIDSMVENIQKLQKEKEEKRELGEDDLVFQVSLSGEDTKRFYLVDNVGRVDFLRLLQTFAEQKRENKSPEQFLKGHGVHLDLWKDSENPERNENMPNFYDVLYKDAENIIDASKFSILVQVELMISRAEYGHTTLGKEEHNLAVRYAYKLDNPRETQKLIKDLVNATENPGIRGIQEIMEDAQAEIDTLPDNKIGLMQMHDFGYRNDSVLPLTMERAVTLHHKGLHIYNLHEDGSSTLMNTELDILEAGGMFGVDARAWDSYLVMESVREENKEREIQTESAPEKSISQEQAAEEYQEIEIFEVPALFSNGRIAESDVPEGFYRYDLRGSDDDPGDPIAVENYVAVNHAGVILATRPLPIPERGFLNLSEGLNFTGGISTPEQFRQYLTEIDSAELEEKMQDSVIYSNEELLYTDTADRYAIFQIDENGKGKEYLFFNMEFIQKKGMEVKGSDYSLVYGGRLGQQENLDTIYEKFNLNHPEGYTGHSLSVSDIVVVNRGGQVSAYFVDSFGFTELPDFVHQREQLIEKEAAQDLDEKTYPPLYIYTIDYAMEHGRADDYLESRKLNLDCKKAVEDAIRENFDGMHLEHDAADPVIEEYGAERVTFVLANTVQQLKDDGRFSWQTKEWARGFEIPENISRGMDLNADYVVTSHPAVLDGFIGLARDKIRDLEISQETETQINRETRGFIADGHFGTWHTAGMRVIGGETFYLMEHDEYEDSVAAIIVNQDGKLVAEDLENGFDQTAKAVIREYLAERERSGEQKKSFIAQYYVIPNDRGEGFEREYQYFPDFDAAIDAYHQIPNHKDKHIGMESTERPPSRMPLIECRNGAERLNDIEFASLSGKWVREETMEASQKARDYLDNRDTELAYEIERGYFFIQTTSNGYDYTVYNKDFREIDGGVYDNRGIPIHDAVDKILIDVGIPTVRCKVMDSEELQERVDAVAQEDLQKMREKIKKPPLVSGQTEPEPALNGQSRAGIEETVLCYAQAQIDEMGLTEEVELLGARVYGSRSREGLYHSDSDIDVVVSYSGNLKEDAFFNVLHEDGLKVAGILIDINPISVEKTGTLEEYLESADKYLDEKQKSLEVDGRNQQTELEATITFYVAECMEFPILGEFHEQLETLQEAMDLYEKIPEERISGLKGIGFCLEDGSIYDGNFDLMEEGEVKKEIINEIPHYRESQLVQKAIADMEEILSERAGRHKLEAQKESESPLIPQKNEEKNAHVQESKKTDTEEHKTNIEDVRVESKAPEPEKTAETTLKTDRSVSAGSKKQSVLNALRERQARMKAQEKRGEKSQTHKKGEQEL